MPKVCTLRQPGIRTPSPARRGETTAKPSSRERSEVATGTVRPATETRASPRKRRRSSFELTRPTIPPGPGMPPGAARDRTRPPPPRPPAGATARSGPRPQFAKLWAIGEDARAAGGSGGVASIGAEREPKALEKATRRGNYESGSDYVLEYGELRFSFNEHDFAQRVEQAAVKLDFIDHGLEVEEVQDLLELAVNGEIREPSSALGDHINEHWTELVGPANRSLVHWIRRLVFRGAWLDQRVKEGELDIVFNPDTHTFGYIQPDRDSEPIELSREPSWARLAYRR
jgi:hypothetical protein